MTMNTALGPVRTVDYHTGGEPFRIVLDGVPEVPGETVADRRMHAIGSGEHDRLRRMLCHEPRGHADMYGCFLVPPDDAGADLGALFWHKDGYSTACGHGTIALGVWAVASGRVPAPHDGHADVVVDVPSGRVTARVRLEDGAPTSVTFRNVASYALGLDVGLDVDGTTVAVDLAYGGAIYACVPASCFGLAVAPEHYADLIRAGRSVKRALAGTSYAEHPGDPRQSGVYGTILYDDLGDGPDGPHQRNVTVFADGEVDRSPCGSGTSARVAVLAARGRLTPDQTLWHDSVVGTRFTARVAEETTAEGRPAVIPEVGGMAYRTGEHRFTCDPADPLATGFVLR